MAKKVGVFLGPEWDLETKMLSLAATGAWAELRRTWALGVDHTQATASLVEWARLWRAKVDHASAVLTELVSRGLVRIEPPECGDINAPLTLCYAAMEKQTSHSLRSSLRVYKSRRDKEKKGMTQIPELFELTEKRRVFAERYRVCNIEHEFQLFCERARREALEYADWDAAWRTWILQGVDRGWIKIKTALVVKPVLKRPPGEPPPAEVREKLARLGVMVGEDKA